MIDTFLWPKTWFLQPHPTPTPTRSLLFNVLFASMNVLLVNLAPSTRPSSLHICPENSVFSGCHEFVGLVDTLEPLI